jgi:hypothetical protein
MRKSAPWLGLLLSIALPASGVLVDTSDPELYERPPPDDPGWRNVGRRGTTTAIYLGAGWVLTARHSSLGAVELDGKTYEPVNGSMRWLDSPLGGVKADLLMFRVEPEPDLPPLALRRRPIKDGDAVTLIGYGRGRGEPARGGPGYRYDQRGEKRWGTNVVEPLRNNIRGPNGVLTLCFTTLFRRGSSPHEAQATAGDSGGAVFHRGPRQWRLAGVMIAVAGSPSQAPDEALFGNLTQSADLGLYAPQILGILGRD